ncbi:hypothetical protein GP486_008748, partial [Trichoglossum hirsutum]
SSRRSAKNGRHVRRMRRISARPKKSVNARLLRLLVRASRRAPLIPLRRRQQVRILPAFVLNSRRLRISLHKPVRFLRGTTRGHQVGLNRYNSMAIINYTRITPSLLTDRATRCTNNVKHPYKATKKPTLMLSQILMFPQPIINN